MTARGVLSAVESRAANPHRWIGAPSDSFRDFLADTTRLVAALRAVLDLHRPIQVAVATSVAGAATSITNATTCHTCRIPGLPQWPCAEYRAITDALNGVTAGTDQ